MTPHPRGMLHGINVVDLTSVVFGPYTTQILADLGANVVKVEPPGGDMFRYAGKPAATPGMGHGHMTLNRGKKCVELDLKAPADAAAMQGLLRSADVFVHNVRKQAIDRLGFGYDAVKTLKPDIVYVHCVGFRSDGPYAGMQAYDDVIQAASGAATLTSRVDGDPRPRFIPSLIADKVSGLHGAYAALAAIVHRLRTGEGQFVEAPMFESFTHFTLKEHFGGATFDPPTGPIGYPRQLDPDRQPFPTADGYIAIVPYTDGDWAKVFDVIGAPEVLHAPQFATRTLRFENIRQLYRALAERTPARTSADWIAAFHAVNIPAMAVRDLADIMNDPHLRETDFFMRREHPTEGAYFDMQAPIRFSADPPEPARFPATVGEHNAALRACATEADFQAFFDKKS
ncbi:MAG: CoA transferase [Alphaproteobacteria bacterium]|nr:CoA transferase [Alphaproteobacteria bacterium]